MSRPQEPPRSFLPFGNPFRMILPKGSSLSPKLLALLNTFEENLAEGLKKLKPVGRDDVLCLSWMRSAMESLCGIHADLKLLITALELPACDWDDKWVDVYFNSSIKLLDISNSFNFEISRLDQGRLSLQCALHELDSASPNRFLEARTSLDECRQHIYSKNSRLDKIFSVVDGLSQTLDLPKIKNSPKERVLMQAMYGVKVASLFICSVFATAFSGSTEKLVDIQVPKTFLWAEAFADLQTSVNTEIRNMHSKGVATFLKELDAVETGFKKLYPIVQDGAENPAEDEALQNLKSYLEVSSEKLLEGLDLLRKEVNSLFRVVLTGRYALLSNLTVAGNGSGRVRANLNVEDQAVR